MKAALRPIARLLSGILFKFWIRPLEEILLGLIDFRPSGVRKFTRRALCWLKDVAWLVFTYGRAEVLRWDGNGWTVLFIHDHTDHSREELKHLLFLDPPAETVLGRIFVWQASSVARHWAARGCLAICDLNRLLHIRTRAGFAFRVPPWLRANLDLSGSPDEILRRMSSANRARIKKFDAQGYTHEFSRSQADFDLFYDRMHVPHITGRFAERAIIGSRASQQALFDRGGLVLIRQHGQPVAGALKHTRGKTLISVCIGLHADHRDLARQNIFHALDWYSIEWARAAGLRSIDFGMTRSRLRDGVFLRKREFGNRFERDILTQTMLTFIGGDLPAGLARRLNELTLIAEHGGEYRCVVLSIDGAAGWSDEELVRIEKAVARAELHGLLRLPDSPPLSNPVRVSERSHREIADA
jgi:hypothetical protein